MVEIACVCECCNFIYMFACVFVCVYASVCRCVFWGEYFSVCDCLCVNECLCVCVCVCLSKYKRMKVFFINYTKAMINGNSKLGQPTILNEFDYGRVLFIFYPVPNYAEVK